LAAGGGGLLGACAAPGAAPAPGAAEGSLAGTTVEYWNMWAPTHPEEVARQKVLDAFTAGNPERITVRTSTAVGQTAADMDKVIAALAAGTPPDLINNWPYRLADVFAKGGTVDVDAELKGNAEWKRAREAIYPHLLPGFTWKGKLFGVPTHNSFDQMYYSPEALKRAGLAAPPPKTWTWEQFTDYSRKAARPPDVTGFDEPWTWHKTGLWALSNGAKLSSADGTKFLMASPEYREAVEWLLGYMKAGLMRPHDGSGGGGYSEKLPQGGVVFQNGVAARIPLYRQQGTEFGTCFYPLGPRNTTKLNYTQGSPYAFSVFKSADGRRVRAALLAALWAARPESGMTFAAIGGVTTSYKNIVESAAFQETFRKDALSWPFHEALPGSLPWPSFPTFEQAQTAANTQLKAIWSGTTSVADGLKEAERLGQQVLDEALRGA
ncbi:MAG TPA: extracellular solute-binding protein, partial [Chloroflexota bacterium]|nr:extracellular solute-binding protein [Chloroflexota bacterium]